MWFARRNIADATSMRPNLMSRSSVVLMSLINDHSPATGQTLITFN